ARRADLFAPHAGVLLALSEAGAEREMRWHLAQMLPRLGLEGAARQRAVALLLAFSEDPSRIVRAFALTALAAFAEKDTALRPRVGAMIRAASSEAPAVRARARMLRRDHGWI
ncbi:MAG: hypothetical protein OEM24_03855, partial [Paracoccaceae bacterium]|nr:hypothetical protein [Paracoccaceae bacterium]